MTNIAVGCNGDLREALSHKGGANVQHDFMRGAIGALADSAKCGLVVIDGTGRIQDINQRMSEWTGISLHAVRQQPFANIFPECCDTAVTCIRISEPACDYLESFTRAVQPSAQSQAAHKSTGEEKLECMLCFPFACAEGGVSYAMLFYTPQDSSVLYRSLNSAVRQLQKAECRQQHTSLRLQHVETYLLHTERLASIGQLAAGVAHEINNPIGYVSSNLGTLSGYTRDMLKVIDAIDTTDSMDDLRRLKLNLEYDYIRSDVEALVSESKEGIGRVKRLISALKDFSHVEGEDFRKVDLRNGIEATLNIANNEIKYKAEVVTIYGALPDVECNAAQINQVVLNLLINSAQAITDFGKITVRTGAEGPFVWLEVEDTGRGMEPAVADRIFEPFFTTKPLGQGTGLGLSLSYSIIENHHGRIDVFSTPGQGTRIRVWLPVVQSRLFSPVEAHHAG